LNRKHFAEGPIKPFGPSSDAGLRIDELSGDPESFTESLYAALALYSSILLRSGPTGWLTLDAFHNRKSEVLR